MECTVSLNKKYQDSLMTGIFNAAIKKNMRQNHRNVILVPWSLKSRRLLEIWPWTVQKWGLEHPEKQHGSSLKEAELPVSMEMTKKAMSGLYQYSSVTREHDRTRQPYSTSICSGVACIVHISLYLLWHFGYKTLFSHLERVMSNTSGNRDAMNPMLQPTRA